MSALPCGCDAECRHVCELHTRLLVNLLVKAPHMRELLDAVENLPLPTDNHHAEETEAFKAKVRLLLAEIDSGTASRP